MSFSRNHRRVLGRAHPSDGSFLRRHEGVARLGHTRFSISNRTLNVPALKATINFHFRSGFGLIAF
jgi:hypothetical protein